MVKLAEYLQDGACYQSRATLMLLQFEATIDEKSDAVISVERWENCREQGYIVSLRNKINKQLNIAFFEHRNSDSIHAVKWEQESDIKITIDNAIFGDVYKTKWDTSYKVGYGEFQKMSNWIAAELEKHWLSTK